MTRSIAFAPLAFGVLTAACGPGQGNDQGGGAPSFGGAPGSGGVLSRGGLTAQGGSSSNVAGGASAQGGATSNGGANAQGGAASKGGASAQGGASSGGGAAAGGSKSQGGEAQGGALPHGGAATTGGVSGGTSAEGGASGAAGSGGGIPCKTVDECPMIQAPCVLCDDGSGACPWARCDNGFCTAGLNHCKEADPCAGKACGDTCSTCAPNQSCPAVVEYCDKQLRCQTGEPTCDAGSCAGSGDSCAHGEQCCTGLHCCAGIPVPVGQEHCGAMCPISDQNLKRDFLSVDPDQVLEKLSRLPIGTWAYRTESTTVRHIGPMAQDFMAAFQVGSSDRTILQVDADGVAFAAIQALNARLKALEERNERLERELQKSEQRCPR